MLELFVELLYNGKPKIERVMLCPIAGTGSSNLMVESETGDRQCNPSTHRSRENCEWTWNALLAVEYAHRRNPKIAEKPVRWFCIDPKVG